MTSIFAYGTLEIPEVLEAVTGRYFSAQAATLRGFDRRLVDGQIYPGICRSPRSQVQGTLYAGIDPESLILLDLFEGDFYRREKVRVATASDPSVETGAYVVPIGQHRLLTSARWDREYFRARHLGGFLASCIEFRARTASRLAREPGVRRATGL